MEGGLASSTICGLRRFLSGCAKRGDVLDDVDRPAGMTNSVIPRFFLGNPTDDGWTLQSKVNNSGLHGGSRRRSRN